MLLDNTPVYHLPVENVVSGLKTHVKKGLDEDQILASRSEYGSNALEQVKPKNPFVMFFFHMFNTVTFILYGKFVSGSDPTPISVSTFEVSSLSS